MALGASCSGTPPTIYCVFENGALAGGSPCLTECQSRCNLEAIAGCERAGCVESCSAASAQQSNACLDARYSYWRCLRVAGLPRTTCDGDRAAFSVPAGTCSKERGAALERCPSVDGGLFTDPAAPRDSGVSRDAEE